MFLKQIFTSVFLVTAISFMSVQEGSAQIAPGNLYEAILTQAELVPQQHLNRRGQAELLVLNNGIVPATLVGKDWRWFGQPVNWMTANEIQRASKTNYIDFGQFEIINQRSVSVAFVVHCSEGCARYQHSYDFEYDESTQTWQITRNTSTYIRID
jgi:hypothetical protein